MALIIWDADKDRIYETGAYHGALYSMTSDDDGNIVYGTPVPWNGLSSVSESPSGADANDTYADNMKYLSLRSEEEYGGTIEAYSAPAEFDTCDGRISYGGIIIGQQSRKPFCFSFTSIVGNSLKGNDYGKKYHIVWNATANPSQKQYQTINSSPEPISFSWEFSTIKTTISSSSLNIKPISHIEVDSSRIKNDATRSAFEKSVEALIYDDATSLLAPDAFIEAIQAIDKNS